VSCREARRRLGARLDGRLGPGEREALEAHLAGCAGCRGELARWEASARALRAAGPTAVPPGLAARAFRAALAAPRPAPAPWFLPAARRAALAGALAAAAVWLAALATGAAPRRPPSAEAGQDPIEVAVLLWTEEVGHDAE
jgi:anti-sigma factor RsiW